MEYIPGHGVAVKRYIRKYGETERPPGIPPDAWNNKTLYPPEARAQAAT